jgi:protein O-GlcNAc transferase
VNPVQQPDPRLSEAVAYQRAGRLAEAEHLYRALLADQPLQAEVLHALGTLALGRDAADEAIAYFEQGVAVNPYAAPFHFGLGVALKRKGNIQGAVASYREAARLAPAVPEMHNNLGNALRESGDPSAAAESLRRATTLRPTYAEAHVNLGGALQDLGQIEDAVAAYRQSIELDPELAQAHYNLGILLFRQGDYAAALSAARRAAELRPNQPMVLLNLGNILQALGLADDAIKVFKQAGEIAPRSAEIENNLGNAHFSKGDLSVAMAHYRRALELKPDYASAYNNLGAALQKQGHLEEAIASYRAADRMQPEADTSNNLGLALTIFGQYREAGAAFRRAMELRPDFVIAYRNFLGTLLYDPDLSLADRWSEHVAFGRAMAARVTQPLPPPPNNRDPHRKLRIGYLTSDLYDHPVGRNLAPVLHDRDRRNFEVFIYSDVNRADAMTVRLRADVDEWHSITGGTDEQVAARIREHGIDILVLIAGHFDHNRPQVACWRPAPLQVSFHDPAPSGIAEMDYLIGDPIITPRRGGERFGERIVRLPGFYIHAPPHGSPAVSSLPAAAHGYVTFGSFNNPSKINDRVLKLWGEVLRSVPQSRLLMKFKNWFSNAGLRERILQNVGVDEARIIFRTEETSVTGHLQLYNDIDIALDPFPFSGSTTTFEALWMGVPVVTLLTPAMAGRWSASMLRSLKLGALIASVPEAYVAIAGTLARDLEGLAQLRAQLRDRVLQSPLCNGSARAHQVERLYRAMWQRWCASESGK